MKDKEIHFLKDIVTLLTQDLEKLTRGRENVEKLLESRKHISQPTGLGYDKDEMNDAVKNGKDVKCKNKMNEHASEIKSNNPELKKQ